ncbi:tyrosinase family protein [Halovivax limisalsi]|uniref:tyrosinase family protein n=1 Tax=Halovivax limisalsi TaxID=1453760 RepID=UPI001FFCF5FD|nr:tyrosinase family protein [Halovivax limisalsi]
MRRRTFLETGGAIAGLGVLGTGLAEAGTVPKRRPVRSLADADPNDILGTWAEGIETLRSLPESDPRNWDNQVRIHGNLKRFRNCEHGNWLFLAWHRAYLHYHEEIIREVTGTEAFALPYWNWLDHQALPALFRREPFTNASRTPNNALDATISGRERVAPRLEDPNFLRAIGGWAGTEDRRESVRAGAGAFESPAHDYVHIRVGGDMATGLSPNDPAFWAHHGMVDRLWWEWNARGHPNPDDEAWLDWTFEEHLVDRHGTVVDAVSVRDVLELPDRSYTYPTRIDGAPAAVDPSTHRRTASVSLETPTTVAFGEDVTFGADTTLSGTVDLATVEPYLTGEAPGRVVVAARDIAMPETGWFHGRVFVDPPSSHPDPGSDRCAGCFHFWIAPPAHPPQNQFVDVTDTLRARHRDGDLEDSVEIAIAGDRMRGDGEDTPSTPIERITLEVTRSRIDGAVVEY